MVDLSRTQETITSSKNNGKSSFNNVGCQRIIHKHTQTHRDTHHTVNKDMVQMHINGSWRKSEKLNSPEMLVVKEKIPSQENVLKFLLFLVFLLFCAKIVLF